MTKRIIADTALFICVFWAPWYVTAGLSFIFIILFAEYWEAAAAGLIIDSLYSLPGQKITAGFGVFSLSALLALYLSSLIKTKILYF